MLYKNSPNILLALVTFFTNYFWCVMTNTLGYVCSWEEQTGEVVGLQTRIRSQARKCWSGFAQSECSLVYFYVLLHYRSMGQKGLSEHVWFHLPYLWSHSPVLYSPKHHPADSPTGGHKNSSGGNRTEGSFCNLKKHRDAWVAQLVGCPILGFGSGHDLRVLRLSTKSHLNLSTQCRVFLGLLPSVLFPPEEFLCPPVGESAG